MKAIGRLITGCTVIAITFSGGANHVRGASLATEVMVAQWCLGQVDPNSAAERRRQSDQMLKLTRQAMKEGKLDIAEKYLVRAEKLQASYDSLFTRFVDTPTKVRRDLTQMQAKTGSTSLAAGKQPSGTSAPQPPVKPSRAPAETQRSGLASDGIASGLKPSDISKNDLQRLPPIPGRPNATSGQVATPSKQQVQQWLAQGQAALDIGDLPTAERMARRAEQAGVPDAAFKSGETRPWQLLLNVEQAIRLRGGPVIPAANYEDLRPSTAPSPIERQSYPVKQGIYDPGDDTTRNEFAQAQVPPPAPSSASSLYKQGLEALAAQDRERAMQFFRSAWQQQEDLDPLTRQQLKDKLSLLSGSSGGSREPSRLQEVDTQSGLLRQQLFREIGNEEKAAEQQFRTDPKGAYERLQKLRDRVAQAELDPASLNQLLTLVDRRVNEFQVYIEQHRAEIELNERNQAIEGKITRERQTKLDVQDKLAELVEKFNTLLDEERYAEAEVIAKQVRELSPEDPISRTLMLKSRIYTRLQDQQLYEDRTEDGFLRQLQSIDESSIPYDDRTPMIFDDVKAWDELSRSRRQLLESQSRRLSPVERQIQEALKQQVEVKFTNRPLQEVLDTLQSITGVNIYADVEGMSAEGVSSDTPVTLSLSHPISLKSALHLILEPLRLSYVIQHEVLRITSEQARDSNTYPHVYNVADLVIPIPNFLPGYNVGLPAAIREAHRALGYGGVTQPAGLSSPLTVAANEFQPASYNPSVLAQSNAYGLLPEAGGRPSQLPGSPGAAGGAALADFDTLIELITSTVEPDSWDTIGGPGAIEPFPTNLSLVISQTQEVHDQIADLLTQLRRLQDLQVTIEVRFITLQDNWFERIGVDFDFDIDDNVTTLPRDDSGNSVTIGLTPTGAPTADLDLSFNQDSFGLAAPAFGGFQAANAANFGFAILSDIEAFFLLQAATGDTRSNVLQAPKVTLFNGQQASVNDTSQRPFVTSLIPVVGDFAAAHQPVVVVLSEGTSLNVQAVVSSDRRFVRLTLQPVFSQIGNVDTFTFSGSTTSDTGSFVTDAAGNATGDVDNVTTTTTGTTVQLPTFSFTSVSTTVSVPDGGTILLGGIKRLREGRNEHGVPMLSKVPYINRLFKNVGIGRETQSLMLMVTPRIIIQEEEEEKMGIVN